MWITGCIFSATSFGITSWRRRRKRYVTYFILYNISCSCTLLCSTREALVMLKLIVFHKSFIFFKTDICGRHARMVTENFVLFIKGENKNSPVSRNLLKIFWGKKGKKFICLKAFVVLIFPKNVFAWMPHLWCWWMLSNAHFPPKIVSFRSFNVISNNIVAKIWAIYLWCMTANGSILLRSFIRLHNLHISCE